MNDSNKQGKSKRQKILDKKNVLEQLGEITGQAVNTATEEVKNLGADAVKQILGHYSGDIRPGESLEFRSKAEAAHQAELKKKEEQLFFERRLFTEIQKETTQQLEKLRLRLKVISSEALKVAQSAGNLGEQVKNTLTQNIVVPSEYQINFLEDIISLMVSFRKKIDSTVNWLASSNTRKQKKNFWSMYKKKGASFLLSGESYSQRSAG